MQSLLSGARKSGDTWTGITAPLPYYTTRRLHPEEEKLRVSDIQHSSILTWHKLHQEVKYLQDLELGTDAFRGMKLLDVGAGPMASATCFEGADLYCLEPLLPQYLQAGFPIHYYGKTTFISAPSERIPVPDAFFDAVISANAIDHVDNIGETALEIKRVLKPGGCSECMSTTIRLQSVNHSCLRTSRSSGTSGGAPI